MSRINIQEGTIAQAVAFSSKIPEFVDPPKEKEYHRRLDKTPHLILIAYDDGKPVGFKVGYERDGSFYSWMGAVLPSARRRSVATKLADHQENFARQKGYKIIRFKTRNQHKNMLIFALRRGFDIVGFKEKEIKSTNRILLERVL